MLESCLALVDLDKWWDKSLGSGCPEELDLGLHMFEYMDFLNCSVRGGCLFRRLWSAPFRNKYDRAIRMEL